MQTLAEQAQFCPHCGVALAARAVGGRDRPACPACGHVAFGRFSLGVGGVLQHAGGTLLVQRGENPGRGRWTLPGGYVEEDETPDAAVVREVFEETGLRVRVTRLLAVRATLRDADQNAYFVFGLELDGPPEIHVDGRETVRADFFTPQAMDELEDLAALSRWSAEHAGARGLERVPGEAHLLPLVGNRWTLFGALD